MEIILNTIFCGNSPIERFTIPKPHYENKEWKFGMINVYKMIKIGNKDMSTGGSISYSSFFKISDKDYMNRLIKSISKNKRDKIS